MAAIIEQLNRWESENPEPKVATSSAGAPIDDLQNSMQAGPQGPLLLQDFTLIDLLQHFDRERIPERVVHAKGGGAFGYFEVTSPEITKYCRAKVFSEVGKRTPLAARFSTVGGEQGSPDTVRDPRGFSLKFYTEEGNWDMVGNNTPIFFHRDPMQFPFFIHTQKRNPQTHKKHDPNIFWDWMGLMPESTHQFSFLFSDRGIPDGFRHMNGYSSHTFKFVNSEDVPHYVKMHFKTDQGIRNIPQEEADKLAGSMPDYAVEDLYTKIHEGDHPSWTMYIQVMTFEQAEKLPYDPFDLTKVWFHKDYPLIEVGRFTLDKNPENYFADIEQLGFSPSNMVPGIETSPDPMLQARLFSYNDTHLHRLGTNWEQIPVNQAKCAKNSYNQDGPMRVDKNGGGQPNYYPNSHNGPEVSSVRMWHPQKTSGDIARYPKAHNDNFSQVTLWWSKQSEDHKDRITTNIAKHMAKARDDIKERAINNFAQVDPDYGQRISKKVAQLQEEEKNAPEPEEKPTEPLNPPRKVPGKSGGQSKVQQAQEKGSSVVDQVKEKFHDVKESAGQQISAA